MFFCYKTLDQEKIFCKQIAEMESTVKVWRMR